MVCEFGRSECVGLVDCYASKIRTTSIHAVRDTEVARIPSSLMQHIKRLYPTTVTNLMSLMTNQVGLLKDLPQNNRWYREIFKKLNERDFKKTR